MVEEPWFGFGTLLDVADSLMENLPGQAACAMCDGPNGGLITQDATADAGTPPESMCSCVPEQHEQPYSAPGTCICFFSLWVGRISMRNSGVNR